MNRRTFLKGMGGILIAATVPQILIPKEGGSIVPARTFRRMPIRYDLLPGPRGQFDKWIYPIIANMSPNSGIIDDLIALQPMGGPVSQVVYMDFVQEDRRSWLDKMWERWARGSSRNGEPEMSWEFPSRSDGSIVL